MLCENIAKSISAIETIPKNSFQDHRLNINGKALRRKQRSKSESYRETTTRCDTPQNNTGTSHDSDTLTKPQRSQSSTSFRTLTDRVKRLNPKYMVPTNEASLVISDPGTVKTGCTCERTALDRSTTERIEIQPHLYRARFNIDWEHQRSASIVPKQLRLHQRHVRRVQHQDRPNSPTGPTRKTQGAHRVQSRDRERASRDGSTGNYHQIDWTNPMGQLIDISQESKWQAKNLSWPKSPK